MGHRVSNGRTEVAKGKVQDSPFTDMLVHGRHPFPEDIEEALRKIHELGRKEGRNALGENWPFSPDEFEWERGENLDDAREVLAHMIAMLEAGRGDEILCDPKTQKPFRMKRGEVRR
jgi:hypothetical protein